MFLYFWILPQLMAHFCSGQQVMQNIHSLITRAHLHTRWDLDPVEGRAETYHSSFHPVFPEGDVASTNL